MNEQWAKQYDHAQALAQGGQPEEARLFGLSVLEQLEGGAGTAQDIALWRAFLREVTPQLWPLEKKKRPPPVPVIYNSKVLLITTDTRGYLSIVNPAEKKMLRMLRRAMISDIEIEYPDPILWFIGALQSSVWNSSTDISTPIGVRVSEQSDIAAAAAALRRRLRLPIVPIQVTQKQILEDPAAYSGMLIECEGEWTHGFEISSFAGLWLSPPTPSKAKGAFRTTEQIRVIGWLGYSGEQGLMRGYGHLGASKGGIEAVSIESI